MPEQITSLAGRLSRRGAAALLLLSLCLLPPAGRAAPPASPPAPGSARIWVYRDYEPFETLATPYIRFNGGVIGISRPGGALYRDVPAGTYRVTVDSDGTDVNQFATVALAPGQTVYLKVESLASWASGGGGEHGSSSFARDTFYTRVIPAALARIELSRASSGG